jgi:hypothetical protein
LRSDGLIRRVNEVAGVPEDQDLTVRAARLLQQATGCRLGADISVEKRIPMGGGLGGGDRHELEGRQRLDASSREGCDLAGRHRSCLRASQGTHQVGAEARKLLACKRSDLGACQLLDL